MRRTAFILAAVASAAVLAVHAPEASAQTTQTVSPRAPRESTLGFTYAWQGEVTMTPEGRPVMPSFPAVTEVVAGSAAEQAGLRAGDVIVSVNGRDGKSPPLFRDIRAGSEIVLRIRRGETEREVSFIRPAAAARAPSAPAPTPPRP